MAIEIRPFTVTIPAGTSIGAGFKVALTMPARVVSQIDVRVPPGPRGEMGFGVGSSGVIVIPYGGGSYIVTDDESLVFALENQIDSGAWQFFGYNTGLYDHTVRLYFHCELLSGTGVAGSHPPPDNGGLSSGGGNPVPTPVPTPIPPPVPVPIIPPPIIPPPIIPPSSPNPPVTVPPQLPLPPGSAPAGPSGEIEQLLIALPAAGEVWLLSEETYEPVPDQDSVNALIAAGVPAATVSAATHAALYAASGAVVTLDLGSETLSGTLKITHVG